jgi:hypothetical protein
MTKTLTSFLFLEKQKNALEPLIEELKKTKGVEKKLALISHFKQVSATFENMLAAFPFMLHMEALELLCIKSLIALDQQEILLQPTSDAEDDIKRLVEQLIPIETFYREMGGMIGYHYKVIALILEQHHSSPKALPHSFHHPDGLDFSKDTPHSRKAIRQGLEEMGTFGEIYPVGGAGDRLDLKDAETGEPLPAAQLLFCGRTLLEGLFRDLQAREYLYYKLTHKQLMTPVAMMTSQEKNNHQHIYQICEKQKWFNRPKENFFLFMQPLVPVIAQDGKWVMQEPFSLKLKPGGHGVIWKLAKDAGLFSWFKQHHRPRVLIRQINNPLAGTDHTLLGFLGAGCQDDKAFGFASCSRYLNTSEGMNVVLEEESEGSYCYCTTNIEYTEFKKHNLQDIPQTVNSPFSAFPANTNILFANLEAIEKAVEKCPLPGQLINMKSKFQVTNTDGSISEIHGGRLETTMQNIADSLADCFPKPLPKQDFHRLKTYLTYHDRGKTISVTKHSLVPGGTAAETPEKCFYDLMHNMHDLLQNHCEMEIPPISTFEEYLVNGPQLTALLHPAIGPLYAVIAQKIHGGKLFEQAELILEIAEIDIRNLHLKGSLRISASALMGDIKTDGKLHYSEKTGKCTLRNVQIENRGIDQTSQNIYWKQEVHHTEAMEIIIHGNGEFIAENVIFKGPLKIEVPSGFRMRAYMKNKQISFDTTKIHTPSWYWSYTWDADDRIQLTRQEG